MTVVLLLGCLEHESTNQPNQPCFVWLSRVFVHSDDLPVKFSVLLTPSDPDFRFDLVCCPPCLTVFPRTQTCSLLLLGLYQGDAGGLTVVITLPIDADKGLRYPALPCSVTIESTSIEFPIRRYSTLVGSAALTTRRGGNTPFVTLQGSGEAGEPPLQEGLGRQAHAAPNSAMVRQQPGGAHPNDSKASR